MSFEILVLLFGIALIIGAFLFAKRSMKKLDHEAQVPDIDYVPIKVLSSLEGFNDADLMAMVIELSEQGLEVTYRSLGLALGEVPYFQYSILAKSGQEFEAYEALQKYINKK
jgi:hypothetical protein